MLSWKPLWRAATTNSWRLQCGESGGRIQYIAIVPWRRPDLAIQEIRRVKKLGSVAGIFARGIEWDRPLTHPDHWPIYEEAAEQDLPVTVHVGNGSSPTISRMLEGVPRPFFDEFPRFIPWEKDSSANPTYCTGFNRSSDLPCWTTFPNCGWPFWKRASTGRRGSLKHWAQACGRRSTAGSPSGSLSPAPLTTICLM